MNTPITPPDGGLAIYSTNEPPSLIAIDLRTYIATAALPTATQIAHGYTCEPAAQELARAAVQIADALIAELNKPTK